MKKIKVILIALSLMAHISKASEEKKFSLEFNTWDIALGNYNLTGAINLIPHIAIAPSINFYSFSYSPIIRALDNAIAKESGQKDIKLSELISLSHFSLGLGAKFNTNADACDSGFFAEPLFHVGILRSQRLDGINENDIQGSFETLQKIMKKKKLDATSHLAFTPELRLGYQWVADFGLMFSLGIYGSYVLTKDLNSMFDMADRALSKGKQKDVATGLKAIKAAATKMDGPHAGLLVNFGWAF